MFWRDDIAADHEPHKVLIKRDELVDEQRDGREVPIKFYYPVLEDDSAQVPLVIWSHGLGGSRDGAGFLARFVASNGYAVLNTQHIGTDSSLWEGKPGHPWDNIRKAEITQETALNRYQDVPFVLDQLPAWIAAQDDVAGLVDLDTLGMSGHSFGAITTQIMAGQKVLQDDDLISLKEDRFKAAIAYSPSPPFGYDQASFDTLFADITAPVLYMTGSEDDSPITGKDYRYRIPVFDNSRGDDQYMVVLDDADHMVFAGSRGKLGKNEKRDLHEEQIKILSLAFWDAYLKDDPDAKNWFSGQGLLGYMNGQAEILTR